MNALFLRFLKNFQKAWDDSYYNRFRVNSLDAVHDAIHKGDYYNITTIHTGLASASNTDYYIVGGTETQIHCFINSGFLDIGTVLVYENPIVTGGTGSTITPVNRNRMGTPHTYTGSVKLNPTVTSVGTLLMTLQTGSTTQRAWSTRNEGEFVFDSTKTYLIRHTSGANSNTCQVLINFYEKSAY